MSHSADIKQNINYSIKKWKRTSLYFNSILKSLHLNIVIIDNQKKITLINPAAEKSWELGIHCLRKNIQDIYWGDSKAQIEFYLTEAMNKGEIQTIKSFCFNSKKISAKYFHLDFVPLVDEINNKIGLIIIGTDITEQKILEEEKRLLEGLLPICSYCKKIRENNNNWTILEKYIDDHSDAKFTHSICPDCLERHFPSQVEEINAKKNK